MRVLKRYNQNANHRLLYKYHKTTHAKVTLDKYCVDGKYDPNEELNRDMKKINEEKKKMTKQKYKTKKIRAALEGGQSSLIGQMQKIYAAKIDESTNGHDKSIGEEGKNED